jgi:acetoacetate decarboxylase
MAASTSTNADGTQQRETNRETRGRSQAADDADRLAVYPRGPYRFNDREYLNIRYPADYDALRAVVPEPLEIDDPIARLAAMRMPEMPDLGDAYRMRAGGAGPLRRRFPVRERVSASRILILTDLPRAKRCYDYLDDAR